MRQVAASTPNFPPIPPESKKKVLCGADEPEAIAGLRRHLYASSLYSVGFCMPFVYKNQPFLSRFVPGHVWGSNTAGPQPASVMVIGKMPGRDEVSSLRNFVGPVGKMFQDQLSMLGVDASSWYVTNLIRFNPPENFQGALPRPWINECAPLLLAELALVQPDYVLMLGSEASKELLGTTVDKAYGTVFDFTYQLDPLNAFSTKTAKAVVCLHPGYLMRNAEKTSQFQLSLQQFKSLTEGHTPSLVEPDLNHLVVDNEDDLNNLVDQIITLRPPMVAVDAEWFGRLPEDPGAFLRCYQFSWAPKNAVTVALTHPGGAPRFVGDPYKPFARLMSADFQPRLVGHNVKADLMWLKKPLLAHGVDLEAMSLPPELGDKGPAATRVAGGFDTMLAAHSIRETADFELESLGVYYLGIPRYDLKLQEELDKGITHGYVSDDILYPYSSYDPDVTLRLAYLFNGQWNGVEEHDCVKPGLLDSDPQCHLNSRKSFWIASMAQPSFLEMEERGILFDSHKCMEMRKDFLETRDKLLATFQGEISWPGFNPNSVTQKKEFLFGEELNGKKRGEDNLPVRVRPPNAISLRLVPIQTTTKPPIPWSRVQAEGLIDMYSPSTDKATLGIYAHTEPLVRSLCDLGFLRQALSTALREPSPGTFLGLDDADLLDDEADDGQDISRKGLMDYVCGDGAIHSLYFQTKETGRASAAKPNLMAISKRRDKDYKRLLGSKFWPMRSLFIARPGYVIVEADFIGAELAMMAWLSGDKVMQDHVRRSNLPENDPNHFDIHSSFAVEIFRLNLPPIKSALEEAGKKQYRDAVKCVVAGSRLHTTEGFLKVEDVVGSGLADDEHRFYSGNLSVVNHETTTPIVAVYKGGSKPCIRVETELGYSLDSSVNHWYWVMGVDGNMVFKQAKNLVLGDVVAVRVQDGPFGSNAAFPAYECEENTNFIDCPFPTEFDENWAAMLGLYVAEGSANAVNGAFQLSLAHENDSEFADKTSRLLSDMFGDRLKTSFVPYDTYQNQTRFVVNSVKLCRWLNKHCPGDSHSKRIPDFVFSWPKRLVATMLRWMFEGDGTAKTNGKGFTVVYSTSSEGLAKDVQLLLSQFGIIANRTWETRDGYEGRYWSVSLVSNDSRVKFCEDIGFVTGLKNSKCVSSTPYKLDPRGIPGQVERLRRIMPAVSSPIKEKCRECVRENSRVGLNRSRLQLILSAVVETKLQGQAIDDFRRLQEIASWDVSFQEVESLVDIGFQQVYDVQTTPEKDHLVSYNGMLTHQTIVFGIPYGRGVEALLVAVKEESGLQLTREEGDKIRDSIYRRYSKLAEFFTNTENRVLSHGFLRDPFGGTRRFTVTSDRASVADAKREARNFKIQGGVARAMSMGLYYLKAYRRHVAPLLDYYLINQIHDAAVLEVAIKDVDQVVKQVLPICLSEANQFRPYDDDGKLVSDTICKFGLDIHVYERWGVDLSHDDCDRLGVSRSYGKAPKKKSA